MFQCRDFVHIVVNYSVVNKSGENEGVNNLIPPVPKMENLVLVDSPADGKGALEQEQLQGIARIKVINKLDDISEEDYEQATGILLAHFIQVDKAFLDRCKKLRVVARRGTGIDNVDVEYASKLGIPVLNVPDYGVEEVADTAMSHILSLFRQTTFLHEAVRSGAPLHTVDCMTKMAAASRRIRGKTLGLVGLGNIGKAVAMRAKSFGFNVLYYDPYIPVGVDKALGLERVRTLEEAVERSDCVSLHCTLTSETKHFIGEAQLRRFRKDAFLVNVARGGLVDEEALAKALREGRLAGAALDVHEVEPYQLKGSVFEGIPNLISTPHAAWFSAESRVEVCVSAAKAVYSALTEVDPAKIANCTNIGFLDKDAWKSRISKRSSVKRKH